MNDKSAETWEPVSLELMTLGHAMHRWGEPWQHELELERTRQKFYRAGYADRDNGREARA